MSRSWAGMSVFVGFAVGVSAMGCGDNLSPCPDPAAPNHVVLDVREASALLAYRAGTGPWQALPTQRGRHDLCVAQDYEVVAICAEDDWAYAEYHATTFDEASSLERIGCEPRAPRVQIRLDVPEPVRVFLDDYSEWRASAPWTFERSVTPGTHDLIAASTSVRPRVLVRRDLELWQDTQLEPIDLEAEGTDTIPLAIDLAGAIPNETVGTTVWWMTRSGTLAFFRGDDTTASGVTPSLLAPGDQYKAIVTATSADGHSRWVATRGPNFTTTLTLPPPLVGVAFEATDDGVVSARWSALPFPDFTRVQLGVDDLDLSDNTRRLHFAWATRGWLEAHQATSLAFPTDIPGLDASWLPDLSARYGQSFSIQDLTGDVTYGGSLSEHVDAYQP